MWKASNCWPKPDPAVAAVERVKARPRSLRLLRTRSFVPEQATLPPPAVAQLVESSFRVPPWGAGLTEGLERGFMVVKGAVGVVARPRGSRSYY